MKLVGTCDSCGQRVGLTPGWHRIKPHSPLSIQERPHQHCYGSGFRPKEAFDGTLKAARLRKTLEAIREMADGRRHYDDGGFEALGDVRNLVDKALKSCEVDEACLGQAGRRHTWGAWSAYDEHVFDGTFRYRRECMILGCNTRQKVEDLEPVGKAENLNGMD